MIRLNGNKETEPTKELDMGRAVHRSEPSRWERVVQSRRVKRGTMAFCVAGLMVAVAVLLLACRQSNFYGTVPLPSYNGSPFLPHAINDRGQIVGLVARTGGGHSVAVWDHEGGIRELGPASEGPLVINNAGQIAGTMVDPNGGTRAFLWSPDGGLAPLSPQDAKGTGANAMNNQGQVVGSSRAGPGPPHACLWEDAGGMRDLNPSETQGSVAQRINDAGQVLGILGNGPESQPCLWDLTDPNSVEWILLPGQDAVYLDLNNSGHVLGSMFRPAESPNEPPCKYAMLYHKDRGWTWLFPLPDLKARVRCVNDANQVVYCETHRSLLTNRLPGLFPPRERWYLWDPRRGSISLDRHLRFERTDRIIIRDLNNEGCVVGVVLSRGGTPMRAFLLEPVARKGKE